MRFKYSISDPSQNEFDSLPRVPLILRYGEQRVYAVGLVDSGATYPKRIKRILRQYLEEAYERELHRELTKLDQSFTEWRNGTIGSGELSYRIHQYETGPSRELFKRYNDGPQGMNVAYAIVVGILDESEVPGELIEAISGPLSFYRSLKERNELKEPDEF